MSFQWHIVAGFLYTEVAFLLFLCVPLPPAIRRALVSKLNVGPKVRAALAGVLMLLLLLFTDAWRDIASLETRLSETRHSAGAVEGMYSHLQLQLFRSQRNWYITGFSMIALVVIYRIVGLLHELVARDDAERRAAMEKKAK
eukprot:Opistho-1_new@98153